MKLLAKPLSLLNQLRNDFRAPHRRNKEFWNAVADNPEEASGFFRRTPGWHIGERPLRLNIAGPFRFLDSEAGKIRHLYADEGEMMDSQDSFLRLLRVRRCRWLVGFYDGNGQLNYALCGNDAPYLLDFIASTWSNAVLRAPWELFLIFSSTQEGLKILRSDIPGRGALSPDVMEWVRKIDPVPVGERDEMICYDAVRDKALLGGNSFFFYHNNGKRIPCGTPIIQFEEWRASRPEGSIDCFDDIRDLVFERPKSGGHHVARPETVPLDGR